MILSKYSPELSQEGLSEEEAKALYRLDVPGESPPDVETLDKAYKGLWTTQATFHIKTSIELQQRHDGPAVNVLWSDPEAYEAVAAVDAEHKQRFQRQHPNQTMFLMHGIVKLLDAELTPSGDVIPRLKSDGKPKVLGLQLATKTDELRQNSFSMITAALSINPSQPLYLELDRRYGFVHFDPARDTLRSRVWYAMDQKLRARGDYIKACARNSKDERCKFRADSVDEFLSRGELRAIFTDSIITDLIKSDLELKKSQPWENHVHGSEASENTTRIVPSTQQMFIDEVKLRARYLLAICIRARSPLTCLFNVMYGGPTNLEDADLPIQDWPKCATGELCSAMASVQHHFSVFTFDESDLDDGEKVYKVRKSQTVPIFYHRQLGKGGYGEVFEVSIHPDHHKFYRNPDATFALKCFGENYKSSDFQRENELLGKLNFLRREHITVPIAAWEKDNHFFMLFEKAECTIKDLVRTKQPPSTTDEGFLTLVRQLLNLVNALHAIHIRRGSGLAGSEANWVTGFHHDLTPQNLLTFPGGVWKINDFGTAQIHQALTGDDTSYRTSALNAFGPYSPPEIKRRPGTPDKPRELSRPYDIWSLGCIFLEIAVWVLNHSTEELEACENFQTQRNRESQSDADQNFGYTSFWHQDKAGRILLKPCVEQKIVELTALSRSCGEYSALVGLIKSMISVEPGDRPRTPLIRSRLEAMRDQAEYRLHSAQNRVAGAAILRFASPISTVPNTQLPNPPEPDNDLRPIEYELLSPAPTTPSRRGRAVSPSSETGPRLKRRRTQFENDAGDFEEIPTRNPDEDFAGVGGAPDLGETPSPSNPSNLSIYITSSEAHERPPDVPPERSI